LKLPYDSEAAMIRRTVRGLPQRRPAAIADLMIASIARTRAAAVVTHDTDGLEGYGLTMINPWTGF
jgi:predicted nucleic acid-binding protein